MHISYKGDYAIKTILDLSEHFGEEPVTIQELATRSDIPIKFLEQILLALKRGEFVKSRRGKAGGYTLARDPSQISLGDVMRYIDGPIEPVACVNDDYKGCGDMTGCVLRGVWSKVAESTARIVDTVTFKSLADQRRKMKTAEDYQI
ncbi:MAG TPA: Rrf2 family transcriptional regulator [Spirochaetia bacterium]